MGKARTKMNKGKAALWVFWILFLTLVFTWLGAERFVNKCLNQPPKPMLTEQQKHHYIEEVNKILNAVKEKEDELTPKDFFRYQYALISIEREVDEYLNPPQSLFRVTESLYPYYKSLERKIIKEGRPLGFVMSTAQEDVWNEVGFEGAATDVFTKENLKKLFLWLLKFGFVVFVLVPLIYYHRCQEMGESFKELVLVQPWNFFAYTLFWPVGLMFQYPDGRVGVAWKYHNLKEEYLSGRGWGYRLSEEEEKMLWQQARGRVDKFDEGVANVFAYSKIIAFASTLIIWILSPLHQKGLLAGEVKEKEEITKVVEKEEIDFSGFLQFKYQKSKNKHSFNIPNAVISLAGQVKANLVKWKFEINLAEQKLRDVWILLALDDWIEIKGGRWFAFFTASPPPNEWYLIDYPYVSNDIATIYGIGVRLDGDVGPFRYGIAALNGNEEKGKLTDDNKSKDLYGKLEFSPSENFSIGAVYQRGEQQEGMRRKFGSHINFEIPIFNFKFLSEYMHQEMSNDVKSGWYLTGVWQPLESLQLVSQYETFKESHKRRQNKLTLGLNYFFNNLKLQLNYAISNMGNSLLARAQVSF
jgi:hypothetical protein